MKHLLMPVLIGSAAILLPTSCTPYPEGPPPTPGPDVAQNGPQKTPEELKAEEERLKREQEALANENGTADTGPQIPDTMEDPDVGRPSTKPSTPVARPVPGKPGFVFSPFNNKIIDVKDIPSGTLVADPTYPASEKKYFRVP